MRLIAFLLLMVIPLAACGGGTTETTNTSDLPLADDEPTLLLFYTDN